MFKVTKLVQTCTACPSQWEGKLEDGRYLYIRYRWGILRAGVGPTLTDAVIADSPTVEAVRQVVEARGEKTFPEINHKGECLFHKDVGGAFDGFLTFDEMVDHLNHVLDFNEVVNDEVQSDE